MTGESRIPRMKGGAQGETTGGPDREATVYPEHEETPEITVTPVSVCRVLCQSRQANNEGVRASVWDFFFFLRLCYGRGVKYKVPFRV